jgi:hypothetical protein
LLGGGVCIVFLLRRQVIGALLLRHDVGVAPFLRQGVGGMLSSRGRRLLVCRWGRRVHSDVLAAVKGHVGCAGVALGAGGFGCTRRGRLVSGEVAHLDGVQRSIAAWDCGGLAFVFVVVCVGGVAFPCHDVQVGGACDCSLAFHGRSAGSVASVLVELELSFPGLGCFGRAVKFERGIQLETFSRCCGLR